MSGVVYRTIQSFAAASFTATCRSAWRFAAPARTSATRAGSARSGAHAGDIARALRLTADEIERLGIVQERVHAGAARHADQIELRAIGERHGWHDLHSAARRHRRLRLPDQMHFRVGKLDEHLE